MHAVNTSLLNGSHQCPSVVLNSVWLYTSGFDSLIVLIYEFNYSIVIFCAVLHCLNRWLYIHHHACFYSSSPITVEHT